MRLRVLSDLHLEIGDYEAPLVEADATVFAGDVWTGLRGLEWIRERRPKGRVIYVPGNHEYYGHALPKLTAALEKRGAELGIDVLERTSVEIEGTVFLGCTLWTDFKALGPEGVASAVAAGTMNDYRRIRVSPGYRKLRPSDTAGLHHASKRWLEEQIEAGRTAGAVIVTHHAPSLRSVPPEYENDIICAAYASDLDELIERSSARLWIHGHTHHHADYRIGATRVLSNPRGYADEPVEGFDSDLVVEVSAR